jgi:hypothetical protein
LFIIGAGHSGSTLLAKALNAHSNMFSVSEISNFHEDIDNPKALCGCGTPLQECSFWEDVDQRLKQKLGFGIKEHPHEFRIFQKPGKNLLFNKIVFKLARILAIQLNIKTNRIKHRIHNIAELFNALFDKAQAEIIVDSSKSPRRAFMLSRNLKYYNIKVVHLVRDGRAVLHSYQKGYYRVRLTDPQTGKEQTKTYYADTVRPVNNSVKRWKKDNQSAFSFFKEQNNYYFLRYEDLASNPETELKALLEFLGLSFEPKMLNLNRHTNHMVSGNASRINAEKIEPPFNSWKKELDPQKITYFNSKAGKLNSKLGYQ